MDKLEWDSKFWDIDIFNITENNICNNKDSLSGIKDIGKLWLIQALVSENEVEMINCLEIEGFRFIESKITLKKNITIKVDINENQFKEIEKHELEDYKKDFFTLYGEFSRFALFQAEKINAFYYTWMINSIDGKMDDKCIGYYIDSHLVGFITYKCKDNRLSIGLVGVFPKYQKKGVSQKLLDYVNNTAFDRGCSEVFVSTQGKNPRAINAYIKNGFIFENIKQWYYLTNDENL